MRIKEIVQKMKELTLDNIKCPVCGNAINWVKPIGDFEYNGMVTLLAECWNKNDEGNDNHLFTIRVDNLPAIDLTEEEDG